MSAYILALCRVTNPHENFKTYSERSAELVHRHGGKYIVRGPASRLIKGDLLDGQAVIIIEFPSMTELESFIDDPEYVNEVAPLREGSGEYHFAAYESPPPGMQ